MLAIILALTMKSSAWWGDPNFPDKNHVDATVDLVTPDATVSGNVTFILTCNLPQPSTLKLNGMMIQMDGNNIASYFGTNAQNRLGLPQSFTFNPADYAPDGLHEFRGRCFGEETAGAEIGKLTEVTAGHQLHLAYNRQVSDSSHSIPGGIVDSHAWYDVDVSYPNGGTIDYVYVQIENVHPLIDTPLSGSVQFTGKVTASRSDVTIDHWKLMVDGVAVAEFHGTTSERTVSLDTTTLTDGQHKLQFHGHGLAPGHPPDSQKQLAGQVEIPITVSNGNAPPCAMSDCFDRADSPTLGSMWNTYAPALEISGNQVRNTDLDSKASEFVTSVGSDQDVSADCKVTGSGSNCGVMGRWSDASNHYYTYIDGGLGTVDLWRVQAGVYTKIGSAARAIAYNTNYRLRLLVQGTQISVYFANEGSPAISVADSGVTSGNYGGLHAFAGAAYAVWWDNFKIVAAPGSPSPLLFSDGFDRTSGLGTNWTVPNGSYATDGAYAVSPPLQGNWAKLLPALGTNDYSVVADIIIPAGSYDSGIVVRSNDPSSFTDNLYSAQLWTDGNVYLYRRNNWNWTQLGSYAAGITAGTRYTLKLLATGTSPVHLEVWLDGTQRITYDDSSADALTSGSVGMVNYYQNVKYDSFSVYQQ